MDCPLHRQARLSPDKPFLISASDTMSYQEADLLSARYQSWLRTEGICSGQRLAVCLPNSPQMVCLLFACLREKIIFCPMNLRLPETKIKEMQAFLGSDRLFRELPFPGLEAEQDALVEPEQSATQLFTSGSSGSPKAVEHTLHNHLVSAYSANAFARLDSADRWLCPLPLYHVGGLGIVFRCVLAGAAVVFPSQGQDLSESIRTFIPTQLSLVPTQLIRLMRGELPNCIKRILLGGAPVPSALIEQAKARGLPLATSYGMTETASQIAATPPGESVRGAGRVMVHAEVKISEKGEILIRGQSVSEARLNTNGWLHSGDTGRMEQGILYVEGRMDRQFISGGENIQPEQIEKALMSLEGVSQAVVMPVDDPEFGQRPAAWVDAEVNDLSAERWRQALRETLPGYMIPQRFERLPEGLGLKPVLKQMGNKGSGCPPT